MQSEKEFTDEVAAQESPEATSDSTASKWHTKTYVKPTVKLNEDKQPYLDMTEETKTFGPFFVNRTMRRHLHKLLKKDPRNVRRS